VCGGREETESTMASPSRGAGVKCTIVKIGGQFYVAVYSNELNEQ
jgi:hypothetical protein